MNKRRYVFLGIVVVLLLGGASIIGLHSQSFRLPSSVTPFPTQQKSVSNYFTYPGKSGLTAQSLLVSQTLVSFDHSGMVSGINNRVANANKHEYWAFYVNGKMSDVGAASYVTKDTDKIEWKIEKY